MLISDARIFLCSCCEDFACSITILGTPNNCGKNTITMAQKKPFQTGKASHWIQLQIHTTCDVANTTSFKKSPPRRALFFAVWTRLELATPCVTGRYSNQLNYQTVALLRLQIYTLFLFVQTKKLKNHTNF